MKVFLDIIGCRLNQSEVEGIGNTFRALGHELVADPSQADLAVINTCAVTVKAAADSRKKLRRAGRKGASQVIATGCWATLYPERARSLEGVTGVITNAEKDGLVASLTGVPADRIASLALVRKPLPGDRARTRAFIKVQEGCDNYCTYCLTRLARGRSRSRNLKEILRDIDIALAGGAKEVVLTGVQLGAWGKDFSEKKTFADLLDGILSHGGVQRLRLSSIEPWDFEISILPFWSDKRLCRHLHIPLQSGNDRILKAMGRPILSEGYRRLIDLIRSTISGVAVTTDVIAGFPGESQHDFSITKDFITSIGFAGGHVFTYSPRPGTAAFNMKDQIPPEVAKARNTALRAVFRDSGEAFRRGFLGEQMEVLWESGTRNQGGAWVLSGLTDNYLRVYAVSKQNLWNQLSILSINSEIPEKAAVEGEIL